VDYLEVVKEPIDLALIRARIDSGDYYTSTTQLRADFELMISNCTLYNAPDTPYYKAALNLRTNFPVWFGSA
jgi:hypothetical protein